MTFWSAAALLLAVAAAPAPAPQPPPPPPQIALAQIVVREQIIVRVPARNRMAGPPAPAAIDWRERRGPECIDAKAIAGASLLSTSRVDLIMRDHGRVRAELERSCPALDYYYGFYISPGADGKICADRDAIRSRMGGRCTIERFHALVARPRKD